MNKLMIAEDSGLKLKRKRNVPKRKQDVSQVFPIRDATCYDIFNLSYQRNIDNLTLLSALHVSLVMLK